MSICHHGTFIYYPPDKRKFIPYASAHDVYAAEGINGQKLKSFKLSFDTVHGISDIAVHALIGPSSLNSLQVKVSFTPFAGVEEEGPSSVVYDGEDLLNQYFISLGAKEGHWNELQFNFNGTDPLQNQLNQEKAEALFLFLAANVGAAHANFIKDKINFQASANPERVQAIAKKPDELPEKPRQQSMFYRYQEKPQAKPSVSNGIERWQPDANTKHHHHFFKRMKHGLDHGLDRVCDFLEANFDHEVKEERPRFR